MPHLYISCLGDLSVTFAGKPINDQFDTEKTRALLVYLAVEARRPQSRQRLAGLLWPDQPEERALHNLRQRISQLRKILGEEGAAVPFLLISRDSVQWNPASDYEIDAQRFEQTLDAAYRHYQRRSGQGGLDIYRLQQALARYQGQFLDRFELGDSDLFNEWAALLRENLNHRAVEALAQMAEYHERRGEYELARRALAHLVALAPWEESARAQLMHLFALDRQWSAALHQYGLLRRYLREHLGVEPTRPTQDLFEHIRLAAGQAHEAQAAAQSAAFPPRFPPAPRSLPAAPTPFIGREAELARLSEMLCDPDCRLLTLTGPGGTGKTRLALAAADLQVGSLPDGVFCAPLAALSDPAHLPPAIADALGFAFAERSDPQEQLLAYLRPKRLLLLLDNFEQLLPAPGSTDLLSAILQQAPGVMLLVTSRQRLNLQEEHVFAVEGLPYPDSPAAPLETAGDFAALALFARRACQVRPSFTLSAANLPAVIRICQMLAGLPLGVEIAAAAAWDHSCEEIAGLIAHNANELTAPAANAPTRHRSLRAALDVSWQLLTAPQQALFCQLSVFRGGFTAEAAAAVTPVSRAGTAGADPAAPEAAALPARLSALVDKSLLRRAADGRYDLHAALRQYAEVRLGEVFPGQAAITLERHAQHYAALLAALNAELKGPRQAEALALVHLELENMRSAWDWLAAQRAADAIAACADSLFQYFNSRSYFTEGIAWFQRATQCLDTQDQPATGAERRALSICLARQGALAYRGRQPALTLSALTRSLAILTQLDDAGELAFCLIFLSGLHLRQADYAAATRCAQDSLAHARRLPDPWSEAHALYQLGLIQNRLGFFEQAQPLLAEALAISRCLGNPGRLVAPLNVLGDIACTQGDYAAAGAYFQESLDISRRLNDRHNQAILLNNLATVYQAQQQYAQEKAAFEASLAMCREIGDSEGEAYALNGLGEMAAHLEDYAQAVVYSQQALPIARQAGEPWAIIACLNNLGEALCGLGDFFQAECYLAEGLHTAAEIEAQDLLAHLQVTQARLHQRRGELDLARRLFTEALAHPALEDEPRTKALRWLAELGEDSPRSREER